MSDARGWSPGSDGPRRARWPTLLLVVLVCSLALVPLVSAHAELIASDPSEGERLTDSPAEVRLEFSSRVENANVRVVADDGTRVDAGPARINRQENGRFVTVPLETLERGSYQVRWRVQAADGHTTSDSFTFVIREATPSPTPTATPTVTPTPAGQSTQTPTPAGSSTPIPTAAPTATQTQTPTPTFPVVEQDPPSRDAVLSGGAGGFAEVNPVEALARGLLFTSVLLLVGLPLALVVVVRPVLDRSDPVERRTRILVAGAAGTLLFAALLLAAIRLTDIASQVSIAGVQQFVESSLGLYAVVQVAAAATVLAVTLAAGRTGRPFGPRQLGGVSIAGVLALSTISLSSHSASSVGATATLVDITHLLAVAVWTGGVAAFAVGVPPALLDLDRADRTRTVGRLVQRFGPFAVLSVGLAGATGLLLGAWHVPAATALETTAYGTVLSVKVLVVIAALAMGGLNQLVFGNHLPTGPLETVADGGRSMVPSRRTLSAWFVRAVRIEFALLLVVMVLAGVLTGIPTATHQTAAATEPVPLFIQEGDDPEVRMRLTPAAVGYSVTDITFVSDDERLTADGDVTIRMRHADIGLHRRQIAERQDDGSYSAVVQFPTDGRWIVTVTGTVDGQHVEEQFTPFISAAGAGHDHGSESDEGFGTRLRWGAVITGLGSVVVSAGLFLRRVRD
ncbi:copper resistance CopC/CopD family protein [Natronomonas sp. EA1]|uniref:copper resistance CopC/CopD family protein n=1 Tax=Natronomonas sp. EA1 TaxID=3421655 RepID=UPI003EC0E9CD